MKRSDVNLLAFFKLLDGDVQPWQEPIIAALERDNVKAIRYRFPRR